MGGGRPLFTPRERQILYLLAKGRTNKEVAHEWARSINTVNNHVQSVFANLVLRIVPRPHVGRYATNMRTTRTLRPNLFRRERLITRQPAINDGLSAFSQIVRIEDRRAKQITVCWPQLQLC